MEQQHKLIGQWLLLGVVMLMIQVLLGGVTRLTGSGLSMTEWKPIIGMIPPLNETQWQIAFEKYQKIAQFKFLNQDFTLNNFKFIFFWEWFHRNWAHFISFTFIIPFIYFLKKRMISKPMIPKLIGLFVLGLGQGVIGKIMVDSGLNEENVYVSHIRLAIHFISAMILICFTLWFALQFLIKDNDRMSQPKFKWFTIIILIITFVQMTYGAFMAGMKAATVAPTWPSINGEHFSNTMLLESWINHPLNIHFIHRFLAYLLIILITIWFLKSSKITSSTTFSRLRIWPLVFVLIQTILGISTVLLSTKLARNSFGPFEWSAQIHQLIGMCFSLSLVVMSYVLNKSKIN